MVQKNLKLNCTRLIRPVRLYCSETWTLRKAKERKLSVFGRKILRRIIDRASILTQEIEDTIQ